METELSLLREQNAELLKLNAQLQEQNRLLEQKVQFLLNRLFGRKSEKISPDQLELLLSGMEMGEPPDDEPPPSKPPRRTSSRKRKVRLPEDLPVERTVIDPEEVKSDPAGYVCIGEEESEQLDVTPARYVRRVTIRRKYRKKADRAQAPIIAPAPAQLLQGSLLSPSLGADILVKKFVDHLPLYRQQQILKTRFNIDLPLQTLSDWVGMLTERWLVCIYDEIREELQESDYLQIDETPITYLGREGGGSSKGYLWVYHKPGGAVLFDWHTSRSADCLRTMLAGFRGTIQCDGYGAYTSYVRKHEMIELFCCWAHARRKFDEAKHEAPRVAGWFLKQIQLLYAIERYLRQTNASPKLRGVRRSSDSVMILDRIHRALLALKPNYRPTSKLGDAIGYAINRWTQLKHYIKDGVLEIDNNYVESAIRPSAVGKRNWLFFGHPHAGQRAAIIYTIVQNCRLLNINPFEYLRDVLSRLPSMTNREAWKLTPANWIAEKTRNARRIA